jgi:transcriptional regulator with XRE-family HTH domain
MAPKTTGGIGPTGERVARRIAELRRLRGLTLAQVETELRAIGRPIPLTALSKIENGLRRVDTDDLVALAAVFDVTPTAILLDDDETGGDAQTMPATVSADHSMDTFSPSPGASGRVRVGVVPRRADSFQERELAVPLEQAITAGSTLVLSQVLVGMAGVGKTQLAASYARSEWARGIEVLIWVTAVSARSIISAYADSAVQLGLRERDEPEEAAQAFLAWAETTRRSWLVILDDVQDPAVLRGLWPPESPTGRAIVTTRRRDAVLTRSGRQLLDVGEFTPAEAHAFLERKLGAQASDVRQVDALAQDLGYLPLALAQAAAFMLDQRIDCDSYRRLLSDRFLQQALPEASGLPDDHQRVVAGVWQLAIDQADRARPAHLARPLLQLASVLDPTGIPIEALTSEPARKYLATFLPSPSILISGPDDSSVIAVEVEDVIEALRVLHRFSLVHHDPTSAFGETRVHPLIQRVTREAIAADLETLVALANTAADSLSEAWTDTHDSRFEQLLQSNTFALENAAGPALLHEGRIPPILFRAIQSLGEHGQIRAAVSESTRLFANSSEQLGPDHPDTLTIRRNLAFWRGEAGDAAGAAAAFEELLTDHLRILGPDHPHTLTTRNNLAAWRGHAGDPAGAAAAFEELLADRLRVLGPDHPDTLTTRANLAVWRGEGPDDLNLEHP